MLNEEVQTIVDAQTYLVSPDGSKFELTYFVPGAEATVRWGDEFCGEASDLIVMNGISTRGYFRFETRAGEMRYDGGSVQRGREHGFHVDATDSQKAKLRECVASLLANIDPDVVMAWRVKNAVREHERAVKTTEEAQAVVAEARRIEKEARTAEAQAIEAFYDHKRTATMLARTERPETRAAAEQVARESEAGLR